MARTSIKKVELSISTELFKAAKLKADQEGQSLSEWIIQQVENALQQEQAQVSVALELGRIDSRIDQRTAHLERQIDELTRRVDLLLRERRSHQPLEEKPVLSDAIAR